MFGSQPGACALWDTPAARPRRTLAFVTTVTKTLPVDAASSLADELLRPQAERVDQGVVPRSHLAAIARAGLLGVTAPTALGGGGESASVGREVAEVLAGACGATWFVWTQHALPLGTLVRAEHPRGRELANGGLLAGVAVAHLRRPGPPAVTATRTGGGWRFDGHVGWMTSWGLCDVFLLCALTDNAQVVAALVDAREQPGLTSGLPMRLAAMQATQTVALDLDCLHVPDDAIVEVVQASGWHEADRQKTANASPHTFGLHREIVRRLAATAGRKGDATAAGLARQLDDEGEELRARAYRLIDEVPAGEQVEARLRARAQSLELVVRSATSLIAATGGAAMSLDAAPQRLAREAVFHLVQAQTAAVRDATLHLLAGR